MNYSSLTFMAAATFLAGLFVQKLGIAAAHRFGLYDIPSTRRKHSHPTPVIGGVSLFLTWGAGLALFSVFEPAWFHAHAESLLPIGTSVAILVALGIWDDIKGATPATKLLFQALAAAIVLRFEPALHRLCLDWKSSLSLGPAIWPLAGLWIIGISNAINLIDGLDALAGGTALLVCASVFVLSLWRGNAELVTVAIGALIPAIFAFLRYNWNPAKVFLGDNGSLPLGFLIATMSPLCHTTGQGGLQTWITLSCIVLMLGYPILDMGLAVFRRHRSGLALFKADRNHLHYRIQRLGLNVKDTAILLIAITGYLQMAALVITSMEPPVAMILLSMVALSLCMLLFLIRKVERRNLRRVVQPGKPSAANPLSPTNQALIIDLQPIFETGLLEERARFRPLVSSLHHFLVTQLRPTDVVLNLDSMLALVFDNFDFSPENLERTRERFSKKTTDFLGLAEFHGSLSGLPIYWSTLGPQQASPESWSQLLTRNQAS